MGLTAIVVGAGIAGLASAIALRQANFEVLVMEAGNEVRAAGQAIGIPSNATNILLSFGMDISKTRPCLWTGADVVKADSSPMRCVIQQANPKASALSYFVHRGDYLEALKELAGISGSTGSPVKFRYGCTVSSFDPMVGSVILESGETVKADLIVAGDGVRSKAHRWVVGEERPAEFSGVAVIRFTIPTETILRNSETARVLEISANDRATMYVGAHPSEPRVLRYPCRAGTLQNFGVYTVIGSETDPNRLWAGRKMKDVACELVRGMNKSLASIPSMADENEVYLWKVTDREPLPRFTAGSMALVGDASHPMRSNLGQGAAMAIEDAGVLGVIMKDVRSSDDIPAGLKKWEELRRIRVGSAQLLSRATFGENPWPLQEDFERAQRFMGDLKVPTTAAELVSYFIAGDQLEIAKQSCAA